MQKRLLFLLVILLMSVIYNKNVVNAASKFKIVDDCGEKVLVDYTGKDSIVKVPQGVIRIDGAFKNNKYIKKIELSDSVQEIYDGSFVNLKNLRRVVFSKKLEKIEKGAFKECPRIKKIKINKRCNSIGDWAFSGCTNLRKITVEKGSKHFVVYKGALYNKKKTELILYPRKSKKYKKYVIPKSVKIVDSSAFKNNCYIEKLVINGDFYDGGYDIKAFSGMKRLKTVVFKSKQLVDQISFQNCKKLEKVVLAEGTKKINSKQFYNCKNLVSINFPESLEEIADNAFEGCDKLVLPKIDDSKIIHYPIY